MSEPRGSAEQRVWAAVGDRARHALEAGLSPTDLHTLLLAVLRQRAVAVTPARVMRRWQHDRFVRPSAHDPRRLSTVEGRLWALLPGRFVGIELSPVTPLGTCSAVAGVAQHRVVGTVRGSEVVSDPTNVLAVESATRRRAQDANGRVDLAASHRVLRGQRFDSPGLWAHFRLFALVSSARDRGSGRTEAELLTHHLGFWICALAELVPHAGPWLTCTVWNSPVLDERLRDTVRPALPSTPHPVPVEDDPGRTQGAAYYAGAALGLRARDGEDVVDLGDGGLTDWTARLLGDAKERCMVSCLSVERLATLMPAEAAPPGA